MILLIIIAAVVLLYLFLVSPAVFRRKKTNGKFFLFAHRGLHNEIYPENSLGAFENAVNNGYGIELDVRLSKDGVLYVFHNDTLSEMCGIDNPFYELESEYIDTLYLAETSERIPRFSEVLEKVNGKVPLMIEIKSTNTDMAVCKKTLEELTGYQGEYFIQSFNPIATGYCGKRNSAPCGNLMFDFFSKYAPEKTPLTFLMSSMLLNVCSRPDFINMKVENHSSYQYKLMGIFGIGRGLWVIKNQTELEKVKNKCDFVIFEGFLPERTK